LFCGSGATFNSPGDARPNEWGRFLEEYVTTPILAVAIVWILWVASWIIAARWSDSAAKRPAASEELLYRLATIVGAAMLAVSDRFLGGKLWDLGQAADWTLVAIAVLGLAFTWWARISLGRLWSSSVTKKADHRVIDSGPYAIVRHPIYTGVLAALYATAVLKGAVIGIVGVFLMTLGFWLKARLEERFLRSQLGPDAYDGYRHRVPMLLPFGPRSA
jgi:protein-S-isoprenylcysteine O-methyltransferase Ste14